MGKRCCVYSSAVVACSGRFRALLASDGSLLCAARSVSPLVPVHPRQPFSSLSTMLPAHTEFVTAGRDSLSHLFRLGRAAQRLLFEAVQRKLVAAVHGLWMVDHATEASLGAPLQVSIFSTYVKSIFVQLRRLEGKLPFCVWQALEEGAVQPVGVQVSELFARLGQDAPPSVTVVDMRAALLAAHPDAVPEQVLSRHDGLDLLLPTVSSMKMCTDVRQRYGDWATIRTLEQELFLTCHAMGSLMASTHMFRMRKATPVYEIK